MSGDRRKKQIFILIERRHNATAAKDTEILALLAQGLPPKKIAFLLRLGNIWMVYNAIRRHKAEQAQPNGLQNFAKDHPSQLGKQALH